ncbi:MAG: hypothetical protein WBG61_09960 [Desulfobacterales bacterium]
MYSKTEMSYEKYMVIYWANLSRLKKERGRAMVRRHDNGIWTGHHRGHS